MASREFDEATLLEEARQTTGLKDFGPEEFREGLRVLLETYDGQPFTEKGRARNRRRVLQLLATRLRAQAAFNNFPEIQKRELAPPTILTGLPRSGTSALFNLLATDPTARALLLWETQFPDPLEGLAPGASDPRRDAIEAYYKKSREKNPEFTKIHFASADTPEECVLLHAYSFNGVHLGIEVMLEPYASWYQDQDLRPMYREYHDYLRLLDWQRPGERWLLKAPAHMWAIEAMIEEFPGVGVVWSHRDPLRCVASICSMTAALMKDLAFEKKALGPVVMEFYAKSLDRGLAARASQDPARFVDVQHDEFVANATAAVSRIYRQFDLDRSEDAVAAMERHVREHPQNKHGRHEYGLEEFGLTPSQVRDRFAGYIDDFTK